MRLNRSITNRSSLNTQAPLIDVKNTARLLLCLTIFTSFVVFITPPNTSAAIVRQLPFSARLKTSGGEVVAADGNYSVTFSIYTVESGGTAAWSETQTVAVTNGIISVSLGSQTAFPTSLTFNENAYYLGVKVGSDAEMSPRKRIGSVPTALNADTIDGAHAGTSANEVLLLNSSGNIDIQGSITTATTLQAGSSTLSSLTVSGASTVGTTLAVTGATTLSSTVSVTGAATLASTLATSGTATFSKTGANAVAITGAPAASASSSLLQLGSALSGGSTNGTFVGVNAASGFNGNLLDFQVANTSVFKVQSSGLTIGGSILPASTGLYDLGSSSVHFANAYIDNIVAGSTSTSGTSSTSFTINQNATGDEDSSVAFYRGGVLTSARLLWNAATDTFDLNNGARVIATVPATANYGQLSIGSASTAFDGSTAGYFAGSASGTQLAINAVSGFGGNLVDIQVAGSSKLSVTAAGALTTASAINGLTLTAASDGFTIAGGTTSRTLTVTGAAKTLQGAGTTIALGGNLTLSGAYDLTLTQTGTTNITLPTSGTLATLAGTEVLSNKTIAGATISGNLTGSGTPTLSGFGTINGATLSGSTLSATALTFSGASGAISTGTTDANLTVNANGTGTIAIGGTSTGDITLGGGSGATGCTVTNASGVFACTSTINGALISGGTLSGGSLTGGTYSGTALTPTGNYVAGSASYTFGLLGSAFTLGNGTYTVGLDADVAAANGVLSILTSATQSKLRVYDSSAVGYTELTHNGTNGVLTSSTGELQLTGAGTNQFIIGDVGTASNLVFEESSTISGQGGNTITLGQTSDIFDLNSNTTGATYRIGVLTAPTVAQVNTTSTGSTALTINGPTSMSANLLDLQVNGSNKASISAAGLLTSVGLTSSGTSTFTGQIASSLAGAASTPPITATGAWYTGGSATTTKPQLLIEPTSTTSTGWSTSGTGIGVNGASAFTGNLLDAQLNGTSKFKITYTGASTAASTLTVSAGGVVVTGNSTITGTLGGLTGVTVASGGAAITGNSTITGTLGNLTGLTSSGTITFSGLTTDGIVTVASGILSSSASVGATNGGTGQTTVTTGDLLYGSGTNTWGKLADVATGSVLVSGGVGAAPSYSATPTLTSLTATTLTTATLTSTGALAVTSAAAGNISLTPNGTGDIRLVVSGNASQEVFIGDGGTTDYAKFDTSGALTFAGNARPYGEITLLPVDAVDDDDQTIDCSIVQNDTNTGAWHKSVDCGNYVDNGAGDSDEYIFWQFKLPGNYANSTNVQVDIYWYAPAATTGAAIFDVGYAGVADDEDYDAPTITTVSGSALTTAGVAKKINTSTVTLTSPSLSADDLVHLKINRDTNHVSDTLAEDAKIVKVRVKYLVGS